LWALITFDSIFFFRNLQAAIGSYYDFDQPNVKLPELAFVSDVTIGEGEAVPPNTTFIKTWRIGNAGLLKFVTIIKKLLVFQSN